ncbi:substrate-binding periplasmic protein [Pseudomonas sp. N040]|uniref:substrate-binding periplasmic protein n=1 Tax=Pseudomonas sp. N040 TaxID=2785325 RepID=UPI0018A2F9C3|nr:transporter substrate-binding domain-containing protein [Pseudomonas sp. N040]MBF7730908.1 transporter substrate-binding domain-containing protein [Pseudomonas sp. N040]MBW7014551.1 transporter substrate-binding domain-containing protein [Pseudomonas sp. N040]
MRVGLVISVLLCGIFAALPARAAEDPLPAEILAVSEAWEGYTNADGSGLGWELLRKIFQPAGVRVRTEAMPYTRAIGLVQRGKADVWLGSYQDEVSGVIYPRWHYDTDQVFALGLAASPQPDAASIGRFRLFWMRGYDYQDHLANVSIYSEIQRREVVLEMLQNRRADFYIDAVEEIDGVLAKAADQSAFRVTRLTSLPLYMGFAPNARGRAFAALFDQRMSELVNSGQLRAIFAGWNKPYPFDAAEGQPALH